MFKGLHGLNPGNQAFKQFKCPVLNVLISCTSVAHWIGDWMCCQSQSDMILKKNFACWESNLDHYVLYDLIRESCG